MKPADRINAIATLGEILRGTLAGESSEYSARINSLIGSQEITNPWFTPDYVRMAIAAIANELTHEKLEKWCSMYPGLSDEHEPENIGVIMAGNIPMVGFHDFLSVLITGNRLIAKTSSKDPDLLPFIASVLCRINPEFSPLINFVDKLSGFDKIIATGSDNSSRYFEYYFGKYPGIIRKNRSSVGIISGDESDTELQSLGMDIFSYFGLGCRNISKLYVPEGYDFSRMIASWDKNSDLVSHHKYANNLDFNKAVYMVNREKFIDAGFVLLKESKALQSPVSVVYFEHYDKNAIQELISGLDKDKIQLICGKNHTPFGMAQAPSLWDYADGTDTIAFLLKKNQQVRL